MSDEPKRPLDYDRTTTAVSVRGFRVLLLLTLLNTAMLGWFTVTGSQGPQFVRQQWQNWKHKREIRRQEAVVLAQQQQCLAHAAPADQVIYTEDPKRAAALAVTGSAYRRVEVSRVTVPDWPAPVQLSPPPYWVSLEKVGLVSHGLQASMAPLVFLHECATPSGQRRLVVVQLEARQQFEKGSTGDPDEVRMLRRLGAFAYTPFAPGAPATWLHTAAELRLPGGDVVNVRKAADGSYTVRRPPPLTLFAGQPDPADPTHFTIPYDIGGQGGVIDGWVRDADLLIKPRSGIPKFDAGRQIWELGVSPTTAPTTAPSTRPSRP